ncbi:MAG TPA: hypothetical protein VMF67_12330 [Rhizomicrobium sp.]|nr:hypothetical protein [Rhizomicrobium sp.]
MGIKFLAGAACAAIVLGSGSVGASSATYYFALVPATSTGTDSGVAFTAGQKVKVKASGYATIFDAEPLPTCPSSNYCWSSPAGFGSTDSQDTDPSCAPYSLIGYIAGSTTYHCLGKGGGFTADATGDLILLMNDETCCYSDNGGDYAVLVEPPK